MKLSERFENVVRPLASYSEAFSKMKPTYTTSKVSYTANNLREASFPKIKVESTATRKCPDLLSHVWPAWIVMDISC